MIGFVAAVLLGLAALGQPVLAQSAAPADPCCLVAPSGPAIRALDDLPFPDELAGGPSNVHVYFGVRDGKPLYAGITNNVGRRQAQHGDQFVLDPLTTDPVTRGQARAIEQALIERNPGFKNEINSISPRLSYYQSAVDWGEAWLQANGY